MEQQLTSERWRRVKQIFHAAVELPGAEREAYLADACADDPSLRSEVESLIAAHERPGSFMDTPLFDLAEEPAVNPLVGKSLGRYRILALLGRGGVGEVYKAKDTVLGRDVAIKVLSSDFSSDLDRLSRFTQEARAASALNHPNIITIHEFGQADGVHFIVSEFIEGETLRRLIADRRMGESEILEIAIQIAGALNAAHEAGIVHRDIKPENIMARPDGLIKVLDFGLAKLIEPDSSESAANETEASTLDWGRTGAGVVMGTINYMSPEQARGLPVDARSDIFSFGVALYEMAAGRSPFARATIADVIASILEKDPPPLAEFAPEASEAMEAIIRKALRKDRDERYQTVGEMLADLKSLKSGEAVVPRAQAWKKSLVGTVKRRWRAAAIALAALGAMIAGLVHYGAGGRTIESIAVLPFVNANGNLETEYLADGVTESVINNLIQLSNLKVRPRPTVFRYKKRDVDPQAAGRELDVEAVLTGQVASRGDEITVSVQLIDVPENRQIWGKKYNGRLSDLLLTQARIAREVTENLRLRLSAGDQRQLAKLPTNNPAAYDLYLHGRSYWNQRTREGYRRAMRFFNEAIELDPDFALAHAGLADCYVLGGGQQTSARETMPRAREAALRAMKLDPSLGEAHASLAQVQLFYDWNFAEAEASFKRAIALKPSYETARHWYALMLAFSGRFTDAIDQISRAQEIDPDSPIIYKDAGLIYYYAGQYEQAIEQCRKALDLAPDLYSTHSALGDIYLRMGKTEDAFAELRKADDLADDRYLFPKVAIGYAYGVTGQKEKAQAALNELRRTSAGRPIPAFYMATLYTGLGRKDEAFKSLEQAFKERAYRMIFLKVDPAFDPLRPDPRFAKLARDIGLAP